MREIGQSSVPTGELEGVTFSSLRLAETKERVDIMLDERMLSVQGRKQGSLDIRLNAIHTVKHHSSQLVPGWMVVFGLCFLWIGYRVMVPPLYRLGFMAAGSALVLARFVTKQPTLTVQTQSGDTHVMFGNERALNRLSFMFHQLANGKSMQEVMAMMEAIEAEMDHGSLTEDVPPAPILPHALHTPHAVDAFLASSGEEVEAKPILVDHVEPDWTPVQEPEPIAPSQITGFFPTFLATHTEALTGLNPDDYRPRPTAGHVLVPVGAPPMHQAYNQNQPPGGNYLPSSHGQHLQPVATSQFSGIDEDIEQLLDADQVEQALVDNEPAQPTPQEHVPLPPAREPLFRPRRPRELSDTMFIPRRQRTLHPRRFGNGLFGNVRQRSRAVLGSMRPARSPSPYATTATSSALRENAEAARTGPTNVHDSLSIENGGSLPPEEAARLSERAETLQAAAVEIQQSNGGDLNAFSFEDLQPSKSKDDLDGLPRLDED